MNPKYITCNYTDLYGTKFNGRLNRDLIYMYSLRAIAECGDTILNYSCPYSMGFTEPYFQKENVTNVITLEYDLKKSPYHDRVDAIKDKKPYYYNDTSWLNRCVEIMWGKFIWMENSYNVMGEDDYLFWIDAGLSHGGILPRMFNTFHNNPAYYRPENPSEMQLEFAHRHDLIFNKDFTSKLEVYTGDKVLLITANHNQHGDTLGFEYVNSLYQWPVGGLFGGKKKAMLPFIQRFKELAEVVLNNECLVKEEQIMAVILNEHPDWCKTFTFQNWYHPDWDVYNPELISFYKFFEEVLNVP